MNFSEVFQTLNQASAFDLYRLRGAIDRALEDPRWLQAIQSRLKIGQTVQCAQSQWRVAYSLLHRVVDVDGAVHDVAELGTARVPGILG